MTILWLKIKLLNLKSDISIRQREMVEGLSC